MLTRAKKFLRYVHEMMFTKPSKKPKQKLDSTTLFLLEELGFDAEVEVKKEEKNAVHKRED